MDTRLLWTRFRLWFRKRKAVLAYVLLALVIAYNFYQVEAQRDERREINYQSRAQVTNILCGVARAQGQGLRNLIDLTVANAVKQRGKPLTEPEKKYIDSLRDTVVVPDCKEILKQVR